MTDKLDGMVEALKAALPLGCAAYLNKENARAALQAIGIEALVRDAERYRWLRDESGNDLNAPFVCGVHGAAMGDDGWLVGETLDEAIDAAMEASSGR